MENSFLIIFLVIGFVLVFVIQALSTKKRSASEEKVLKGYFLLGLSGLMAKIAMADGQVTGNEAEMASRFFARMDLTEAEKAILIGNFVSSRRDGLEARDHAKRFMAYANSAACEFLYDMLWRISRVDGTVTDSEDTLLKQIAVYLGLPEAVYEYFKAGKKPTHDRAALKAAGVPPSLLALAR